MSGDVTISNAGVTSISSGVIVDGDINTSASIQRSKIATGTASRIIYNDNTTGALTEEAELTYDDTNNELRVAGDLNAGAEGSLKLEDAVGGEYLAFKAPTTLTGSQTFTLPDGDGSVNQILQTNGLGTLSWVNQGTSFDFTASNDNRLIRSDAVGANEIQESGITVDDSDNITGVANLSANKLSAISTTDASHPCPSMTEVERDALTPSSGDCVDNITAGQFERYDGSSWGAIAGGDADTGSFLEQGGFDASDSGTSSNYGLICGAGNTCVQETVNQFIGDGALKATVSSNAFNISKTFSNVNTQVDNHLLQFEVWVKSSEPTIEVCALLDGVESNCISYDGSDEWRKIKIIEQVINEDTVGYKVKSASTSDDLFLDFSSVKPLVVDGTTKVSESFVSAQVDPATMTVATGYLRFGASNITIKGDNFTYDDSDGYFTCVRDQTVVTTFTKRSTSVNGVTDIYYNAAGGGDVAQSRAQDGNGSIWVNNSATFECIAGGKFRYYANTALQSGQTQWLTISSTHYEQKSVLSDATAEATFTDWEQYTTDCTGNWVTNTTYTCFKRRNGDNIELKIEVDINGGAPPSSNLNLNIPSAWPIDESKIPVTSVTGRAVVGKAHSQNFASVGYTGKVIYISGASIFYATHSETGNNGVVDGTNPFAFNNDDSINLTISYPVVGWSTKPQIVGTFKPAVRAVRYSTNAGQSISHATETRLDFEDLEYDQDSLVTTGASWKYTVPETGKYRVNALVTFAAFTPVNGTSLYMRLYKNSGASPVDQGPREILVADKVNSLHPVEYTSENEFVEGDELYMTVYHDGGGVKPLLASNETNYINIIRIDQAGRLSQEEPKKFQRKCLSAPKTTTGVMSDLTFNLTPGKWYSLDANFIATEIDTGNNTKDLAIQIKDGSTIIRQNSSRTADLILKDQTFSPSVTFKAVDGTITAEVTSITRMSIFGNGTIAQSCMSVREANITETNQW